MISPHQQKIPASFHPPRFPRAWNFFDMSAPQIPNLSTFRRRGGPGRFRSREGAGGPGSHGASSKDRVVQGTDNDASVSRLSAVRLGYLEDPFAQALTPPGLETRRFPIINRGMYVARNIVQSGMAINHQRTL